MEIKRDAAQNHNLDMETVEFFTIKGVVVMAGVEDCGTLSKATRNIFEIQRLGDLAQSGTVECRNVGEHDVCNLALVNITRDMRVYRCLQHGVRNRVTPGVHGQYGTRTDG